MTYYIYHIPGKKIGVTCDLINRVTVQQGYGPDEYEVLEESKDIDYISDREIELQKEYDCIKSFEDLQAITHPRKPNQIHQETIEVKE